MIDFHCHILPGIDDGSKSVDMSLRMLEDSIRQGVDHMVATPHFDANFTDPHTFVAERQCAQMKLQEAMSAFPQVSFPQISLGAEVQYFPGMSGAEELELLRMGNSRCVLIEPPMKPWTRQILDEIERVGYLRLVPVIAHIDRYMRLLKDDTLLNQVIERQILVQVNASYFLYRETKDAALWYLQQGRVHFLGSDCHNMEKRKQNLGLAKDVIQAAGAEMHLNELNRKGKKILGIN